MGLEKSKSRKAAEAEYEAILSRFGAESRTNAECVKHLQSLGFTVGQARNAAYRYRLRHRLLPLNHGDHRDTDRSS